MASETGAISLQAKDAKDADNHQKLGERLGTDSPSQSPERTSPASP